ncbi:MAG: YfaZ family outer membrane protein [Leptospirales bacterium]|nr:YfaZ family outer membrane protein [Leptospirales bacterium]
MDVNLIYSAYSESGYYPYVRVTYSFSDKLKMDVEGKPLFGMGSTFSANGNTSGKGWGIGGGIEYMISPNLKLFGEYMYEKSSYKSLDVEDTSSTSPITIDDFILVTMSFNVGIKYLVSME